MSRTICLESLHSIQFEGRKFDGLVGKFVGVVGWFWGVGGGVWERPKIVEIISPIAECALGICAAQTVTTKKKKRAANRDTIVCRSETRWLS
jgi:hypothetical protein